MTEPTTRRAEYAAATRRALIEAATELFTDRGFAATSIEDVVQKARVTRGALYHHFTNKADLFLAVFEELEQRLMDDVSRAAYSGADPWELLTKGTNAFLDACLDPPIQRIVLLEAPTVLGWVKWRELDERYGLGLTSAALQQAMDAGVIDKQPLEPLAHMLLAALNEAALFIATSPDRKKARREIGKTITRILEGLRTKS